MGRSRMRLPSLCQTFTSTSLSQRLMSHRQQYAGMLTGFTSAGRRNMGGDGPKMVGVHLTRNSHSGFTPASEQPPQPMLNHPKPHQPQSQLHCRHPSLPIDRLQA